MKMNQQVVQNKNLLLKNEELTKHSVRVNPDDEMQVMEVWVRDISFLDIQAAAQEMFKVNKGDITLSLGGYWRFAFKNWVVKTNPVLSKEELLSISGGYAGGVYQQEQLKVRGFLKKSEIETSEDLELQIETWAYIIAKHYGISLLEVYSMPRHLFRQSLVWALAINEEEKIQQKQQKQKAKSKGNETVNLDYSFLDNGDF